MDIPKLKLVLYQIGTGIVVIFLLSAAVWEYRIGNIFQAIFLPVIAALPCWQAIKNRRHPKWGQFFYFLFCFVWMLFNLHKDDITHQGKLIVERFGPRLNQRRHELGVPTIPAGWEEHVYGDRDGDWKKKNDTTGHYWKMVYLDSLHRLESEEDFYHLKRADGTDRSVSISTYYSKKGRCDSIVYRYEAGMNNNDITRGQADSIFAAEKIKKDY